MTVAFSQAIEAGRAILGKTWQNKFATMDRQFGLSELRCPICAMVIAKLMPVGQQRITRVRNQTIIQEGVSLSYLANYREVLLAMNDGSQHVVNVCSDCAILLSDPAVAVARYAADLSQWSAEGQALTDETCNRSPVSILQVADYIRDNNPVVEQPVEITLTRSV